MQTPLSVPLADLRAMAFKISLARRSSRFWRSNLAIRRCSIMVMHGRWPVSMSACLTQSRSDAVPMPSCLATRDTALPLTLSAINSRTTRIARSRISAGYRRWKPLFGVAMGSCPQRLGASIKPRAVQFATVLGSRPADFGARGR